MYLNRHAFHPHEYPPTREAFEGLLNALHKFYRELDPSLIFKDKASILLPAGERIIDIDVRNTQWLGADQTVEPNRFGYEPDIAVTIEAVLPKDGTFIDVGANWGYFAIYAATDSDFVGKIVAIEPSPRAFRDLCSTIESSDLQKSIVAIPMALSDGSGVLALSDLPFSGENAILEGVPYMGSGIDIVATETLDYIVKTQNLQRVDLVKIDVEGAEAAVIRGARETIKQHKPIIVFENWYKNDTPNLLCFEEILRIDTGYRFYNVNITDNIEINDSQDVLIRGTLLPFTPAERSTFGLRINVLAVPSAFDVSAYDQVSV